MMLLDTNVLSELMKEAPHLNVMKWAEAQGSHNVGLTTLSIAEIRRGMVRLPVGKRREMLETRFDSFLKDVFSARIYAFDLEAAGKYAEVCFKREKQGLHVDAIDMMITAIAIAQHATLATRNITDFTGCGVALVNPWEAD